MDHGDMRRRARTTVCVLLAALFGALAQAGTAAATSDTVVGFDDLAAGTVVGTQYASSDLEFGFQKDLGLAVGAAGDCGPPAVQADALQTTPKDAELAACSGPTPGSDYRGTFGGLLGYRRGRVSLRVRTPTPGASLPLTLTLFDSAGAVVGSAVGTATGSWSTLTTTQSPPAQPARVAYFLVSAPIDPAISPAVAIDDVAFDQAGAPLSASPVPVSAQPGAPFGGPVATITDGDPTAAAGDYTATIDWGDGTSSAGTLAPGASAGEFVVSGTHTFAGAGALTAHVSVTKSTGTAAATDVPVTVGAGSGGSSGGGSPMASISVQGTPQPGGDVTISGAGTTPGAGTIISYDWDFNGDGKVDTSTGANPVAHFAFRPGVHVIGLTVTNSGGATSTSRFALAVPSTTAVIPPDDGGSGPCQTSWDLGRVHILAECIQTDPSGGYVIATRQLHLDGMTFVPRGGGYGVFHIATKKVLTIAGTETLLSGPVADLVLQNTPIGDVVIGGRDLTSDPIILASSSALGKSVPKVITSDDLHKTLLMSLGVGHSCSSDQIKKDPSCCPKAGETTACATVPGGFPLTGQVNVYLDDKGDALLDVQVGLDLKEVGFQATGAMEIVGNPQQGIVLGSLQFTIPQAGLASIFQVKNASFVYYFPGDPVPDRRDTWQAKATLVFGPLDQPNLAAELDFKHGQFNFASMLFTAPKGVGVPIYPGVLLNQLGGQVGVDPLRFGGTLGASIAEALELSLSFAYSEPTDTSLGFFGGQGKLSLDDDDIATLAADVYSDGYTDGKLAIDLHFPFSSDDPVVKVEGNIGFWDEPSSGRWEADGVVRLQLWIISAEVGGLVNDIGVAGCADVAGFGVQGRYRFADGHVDGGLFGFSNCTDQLAQYKETPVSQHTGGFVSRRRAPTATIAVAGGALGEELRIGAASGTPAVTISGPGGAHYVVAPTGKSVTTVPGALIAALAPDGQHLLVLLRHPQAGRWTVTAAPGAPAITTVERAGDLPPAVITASARPLRGRTWALRYRIADHVAGTRVQFVERGRDSTHVIGTTSVPAGTLRFVPEDALGRGRRIVALLQTSSGDPLRTISVGSYRAPGALRGGTVRGLRILRRGASQALVSWAAVAGARS